MQVLGAALGAAAIGLTALAAAFHEGAGKHLPKGAQAANQPASQLQFRIAGHESPPLFQPCQLAREPKSQR